MAVLDIWNRALSVARARGRLDSLVDPSPEQELCDLWYLPVVKIVQSAAYWPCCRAEARLALIAEWADEWVTGNPQSDYQYAYATPANMLRPWHLSNYMRFSLSLNSGQGRTMISTNDDAPILTYGVLQENTTLWPVGMVEAVVNGLGASIVGQLTGKNQLTQSLIEQANRLLMDGQAQAANDTQDQVRRQVPWLAARGYGRVSPTRYYYPVGGLFS